MSNLSWGTVFRGRRRRLKEELRKFLSTRGSGPAYLPESEWFVSSNFLESALEIDELTKTLSLPAHLLSAIERTPNEALLDYLTHSDASTRLAAVVNQSAGLSGFQAAIEARRNAWQVEALAMRRRAYGATLFLSDQAEILTTAFECGLPPDAFSERNGTLARELIMSVPAFDVERELALRIESQARSVTENDLRDMANFVAAIPYADVIVAEKAFVGLAQQADLHTKYETTLLTNLDELEEWL